MKCKEKKQISNILQQRGGEASNAPAMPAFTFFWTSFVFFLLVKAFEAKDSKEMPVLFIFTIKIVSHWLFMLLVLDFNMQILN